MTADVAARHPVHTVLSPFLAKPGVGVGIYDREGVSPGDSYTRTYTFTRTSGPASPSSYGISWTGNDEMDQAQGHGWAELQPDGSLKGQICFQDGDEADFIARRETSSTPC